MNSARYVIAALMLCAFAEVQPGKIVLTTGRSLQYQCFPFDGDYFEVEAKATNDVIILLANLPSDGDKENKNKQFYKIIHGGWKNTQSTIAKDSWDNKVVVIKDKIQGNIFGTYWVKLDRVNNIVATGRGTNPTPVMQYTDPDPPTIHYFCLTTDQDTGGKWFIDTKYLNFSNSSDAAFETILS